MDKDLKFIPQNDNMFMSDKYCEDVGLPDLLFMSEGATLTLKDEYIKRDFKTNDGSKIMCALLIKPIEGD